MQDHQCAYFDPYFKHLVVCLIHLYNFCVSESPHSVCKAMSRFPARAESLHQKEFRIGQCLEITFVGLKKKVDFVLPDGAQSAESALHYIISNLTSIFSQSNGSICDAAVFKKVE